MLSRQYNFPDILAMSALTRGNLDRCRPYLFWVMQWSMVMSRRDLQHKLNT